MNGNQEQNARIDAKLRTKLQMYPSILSSYYDWLLSDGKTYRTAKTYMESLMQFVRFRFGEDIPIDFYTDVVTSDIEEYLASIQSRRSDGTPSNAAKATNWSVLSSFFQYLIPSHLDSNPVSALKRPSINKDVEMVYLSPEETARLFENVRQNANIRQINRDMSIFMLGFYCGLNSAAIVQLNLENVDLENGVLTVYSSKDEPFRVPISARVRSTLRAWINDRRIYFDAFNTNAVFISQENGRLSARSISDLIEKYSDGIDKRITTQVMRNTCVINLYRETGDIRLCQKYLNHANVSSTQRYIEQLTSNKSVEEAVDIVDGTYQNKMSQGKSTSETDIWNKLSGRERCMLLRQIRKEIAESNGIVYLSTECKIDGECSVPCPQCEAEIRYLDTEIRRLILSGAKFTLAGLTLNSEAEKAVVEKTPSPLQRKLSMTLDDMDFTVRTYQVLKRANIMTVGDIVKLTGEDLMKVRHMGRKSLDEIRKQLGILNLSLKDEVE